MHNPLKFILLHVGLHGRITRKRHDWSVDPRPALAIRQTVSSLVADRMRTVLTRNGRKTVPTGVTDGRLRNWGIAKFGLTSRRLLTATRHRPSWLSTLASALEIGGHHPARQPHPFGMAVTVTGDLSTRKVCTSANPPGNLHQGCRRKDRIIPTQNHHGNIGKGDPPFQNRGRDQEGNRLVAHRLDLGRPVRVRRMDGHPALNPSQLQGLTDTGRSPRAAQTIGTMMLGQIPRTGESTRSAGDCVKSLRHRHANRRSICGNKWP